MGQPVVNIRIEVDPETDDALEAWAMREHRSKREHVCYVVNELLECYRRDPLILHRLALGRSAGEMSRPLSA